MSGKSIISNDHLTAIGNSIRYKKGTDETYYPSQMAEAIRSIEGIVPTGSIEISENDTYDVTEYASAVVDVQPDLRPLAINENGEYTPDGFDGYSLVTADVEPVLETLSCTENGLYLPESGVDGFDRVIVNTDIQWDGTLYPVTDETDPLYADRVFNGKHIAVVAGDTVILEGMGRGRWFGWYRGNKGGSYASNNVNLNVLSEGFTFVRYVLPVTADATLVLAEYEWTNDGAHGTNSTYCFFGDYLRWKVIHAT